MGQKFAIFDNNGFPSAFYDSDVNADIPAQATEISAAQWQEFIDHAGLRKMVNGAMEAYTPPAAEPPVVNYPMQAVLQSPDGTPFMVMVDNDGNLETMPMEEANA